MGNTISYLTETGYQLLFSSYGTFKTDEFSYAIQDPTQLIKPEGRTKDIICSKLRHRPKNLDTLVVKGCDSVWKHFKRSVWRFPNRQFFGQRKNLYANVNSYQTQDFQRGQYGEYEWKSYQEIDDMVESLSKIIIKKKLCKQIISQVQGTPNLKYMGIFSENRYEWFTTQIACCSDSIVVVPISLQNYFQAEDFIIKIFELSELQTLCVSRLTLGVVLELKSRQKLTFLKNLILFDHVEEVHTSLAQQLGLQLYSFEDLVKEGMREIDVDRDEPGYNSVFLLGVTSGTTQDPKITMLTHKNFISGQLSHEFLGYNFTENDVYISYVPLTHVQEQLLHVTALIFGFSIGYSSDSFSNLLNDIKVLKPTIFGSFPVFYNQIYAKIKETLSNQPAFLQSILDQAIKSKLWYYLKFGQVKHLVYDTIFLSQIRNIMGGRMRILFSGGAPLSPEIKDFLQVIFSVNMFESYGSTETAGFLTSTAIWDRQGGHVGGILGCIKLQLRDVPSLKCSTDSNLPQGEIYVKGNAVMLGYFKNPELTSQMIDDEGWLKIGDIGILHKNGAIEIVERTDEVKKLQNGQLIAPTRLEAIYQNAPLINQIVIDVNPNYNFLVAVVTLNDDKLQQYAEVNGIVGDKENLLNSRDIEFGIIKQLERIAINNKLEETEKIQKVFVVKDPFSQKNGMMTNTQKIRRDQIKITYQKEIQNLYIQHTRAYQQDSKNSHTNQF